MMYWSYFYSNQLRGARQSAWAFILLVLTSGTWAQVSLFDAFNVDPVTCAGQMSDLPDYWIDSFHLVNLARQAFANYATDQNAREALTTYFGIVPNPAQNGAAPGSQAGFTLVQSKF